MKHSINTERGFIKYIVLAIALLILIAYFRKDIAALLQSPGLKEAVVVAAGWLQIALSWVISKLG